MHFLFKKKKKYFAFNNEKFYFASNIFFFPSFFFTPPPFPQFSPQLKSLTFDLCDRTGISGASETFQITSNFSPYSFSLPSAASTSRKRPSKKKKKEKKKLVNILRVLFQFHVSKLFFLLLSCEMPDGTQLIK